MRKLLVLLMLLALIGTGCQAITGRTTGETVDDAYIVSAINEKILADPDLKFLQINVDSYQGNVTLSGRVPSTEAENRLVTMAREVKGVKSVTSNLVVGATPR